MCLLTEEDRQHLQVFVHRGKANARILNRARVLTSSGGELGAGKGPWSLTGPLAQSITAHEIGMLGRKDGQARDEEPMH